MSMTSAPVFAKEFWSAIVIVVIDYKKIGMVYGSTGGNRYRKLETRGDCGGLVSKRTPEVGVIGKWSRVELAVADKCTRKR